MSEFALLDAVKSLPRPAQPARVAVALERWRERAEGEEDPDLANFAAKIAADPVGRGLLGTIFGNSPYLTEVLLREIAFARTLFSAGIEPSLADSRTQLNAQLARPGDAARLMAALRTAKRQAALAIAVADVTGIWELEQVTAALSDLAEVTLEAAAGHALDQAIAAGLPAAGRAACGYVVLGMGKFGAGELNYSSDIDLIVLYDSDRYPADAQEDLQHRFVRATREMVRLMDQRTPDGYVFRVDLRLRPDPGATPVALSLNAAELYYESMGQNWERAAMIKARPVAGDRAAGRAFLERLRPFLWRRHLDFAAIQDVHSIKRQIQAHRGGADVAVNGHNLKLGRGGIREIEFFAQTQQLIWGGRDPRLRVAPTCAALAALAEADRVPERQTRELTSAYRFLRTVEHRLQMVEDAQTHSLPTDDDGIERVAAFMGFPDAASFAETLLLHLRRVERRYAQLFEESPALSAGELADGSPGVRGSLVFTGVENDPETVATLARMGFADGNAVATMVRGWHHGRYRAMRSERARQLLTELKPVLLGAFARTADPDLALRKFDEFLGRLPAGVQLFSLFHANPALLDRVALVMGTAPRLADQLARHPILLDGLLTRDLLAPPSAAPALRRDLARMLEQARDFQDVLMLAERWTEDRRFQAGLQILLGQLDTDAAGAALSAIADVTVGAMLEAVGREFTRQHGRVAGEGVVAVAFGKLGGREMTVGSDLDLLFLHDAAEETLLSDGAKPLPAMTYYARLCQRLIGALTAQGGEGKLYEVDMRLRPSGNAGPIAVTLAGFQRYQRADAWTWEHMALTRARPIAGPPRLQARVRRAVRAILTRPRDPAKLLADVADMRRRMTAAKGEAGAWEVKHRRGGLIDCEFVVQYLQLRHAHDHPSVLHVNTTGALRGLVGAGALAPDDARAIEQAVGLWRAVQGMLRLTQGEPFDADGAPAALRAALARAARSVDFAALRADMERAATAARAVYDRIIEAPAAALPPKSEKEQRS
jgi:glutamate-ammonia-ligase adenylyltransferase